jgi:sterol desaturase/sphingolipid hydroxylase (fatty acid hydroxylase superfamily)
MLPWMDRLFGTWYLPRGQWPAGYGIDTKLPDSLGMQLLYPFLRPPEVTTEDAGVANLPERSAG